MTTCIKKDKSVWAFFLLAFALRFIFSYFYPLTLDEAWSQSISKFPLEKLIVELKSDSTSPVLVYLIHKLVNYFHNEALIRAPFWLSGFASLFFIYNACEKRISSIIIPSLSLFAIKEGSIARMHSITLLLSSISFYFFLKTFDSSNKKNFIILTVVSILIAYNFYPTISFVVSLFLSSFIFRKESVSPFRFYLIFFLTFLLFSIPAFYFLDFFSLKNRFVVNFTFPTGAFLPYFLHSFAFSEEFFPYKQISGLNIFFFALMTLPLIIICLNVSKFNRNMKIVLFSSVLSVLIYLIVSLKIPKVLYSPKYLICLYPGFIYILSGGLSAMGKTKKIIFLSFISLLNIVALYKSLNHNREDWRAAAKTVSALAGGNEKIFIFSEQMKFPFSFYYKKPFVALPNNIETKKIWEENPSSIIYIRAHDYDGKSIYYQDEIEKKLKLTKYLRNGDIEFFHYKTI